MTSSRDTYVFVQLPGSFESVVAGHYRVEETHAGPLGRFVYGRSYLDRPDALPLDPVHLPLSDQEFETARMGGMFGALRDTTPDAWGRMILERRDRNRTWTELDYLLGASSVRVGALSYGPTAAAAAASAPTPYQIEDLMRLEAAAAALEGEMEGEVSQLGQDLDAILNPSSGLGGARPKTVVADEYGQLWVAKFPSRGDRRVNAITEAAYLRLAGLCGIRTPETQVIQVNGRPTVLVRRFDKEVEPDGIRRSLYLSAHTILGLDEDVVARRGWSYLDLAHLLRRVSEAPALDVLELYRRMVFNALVTNLDDHPRNHAVIGTASGTWRLSPAFDLVASNDSSMEDRKLAMACGELEGRQRWANRGNLVSGARHFGLLTEEANAIIDEIKDVVLGEWEACIRFYGGTDQDCQNVAYAIAYEGFEY